MKIPEQLKQWIDGRLIRGVQLAVVGWLAIAAITAAARYWITSGQAEKAIAAYQAMEKQSVENAPKDDDRIAKLLANNLFLPAASPKPPQCLAILGDMALFGEEWKKVGETAAGAKILEIGPHFVKVQWNEKEHLLNPFEVEVKYAAPPSAKRPAEAPGGNAPPAQASAPAPPPPSNESRRRGGFDMDQVRRRFESMTPEQRQQMFERYQNASPEERERMRDEFRRNRGD
jgi:hypothetical protein